MRRAANSNCIDSISYFIMAATLRNDCIWTGPYIKTLPTLKFLW